MKSSSVSSFSPSMTTNESPFIEQAKAAGQLYIQQPYDLYSEENHEAWRKLYARMLPRWDRYANQHFLKGIHSLCLDPDRIPHLEDVNRFLKPLTGFQTKAVSGYVPRLCLLRLPPQSRLSLPPSLFAVPTSWITCRSRIFSTT